MKCSKLSVLLVSAVALSGCSSIWSGVSDFADFMADETQFLSFRKSSPVKEIVLADSGRVCAYGHGPQLSASGEPARHFYDQ